jgi:hypothetical protein
MTKNLRAIVDKFGLISYLKLIRAEMSSAMIIQSMAKINESGQNRLPVV